MNFTKEKYKKIIEKFQEHDYRFVNFNRAPHQKNEIILRHDVDFSIDKALEIAEIEKQLSVSATYFFLIRSDSYNFIENSNIKKIKKIHTLGHDVSIHFDSTLYKSAEDGFNLEKDIFRLSIGFEPEVVSFHRPNNFYLDNNDNFFGLPHTYQDKFFKNIKYISDSGGGFFYDDPIECQAFKRGDSIQLLTHPIWWTTHGKTNIEKIHNFLRGASEEYSQHFAKNCKPWKKYLNDQT
tara:strand:- start:28361 stop:29071 length:711 start_codon:yes stop_codon:yes gene_type:complete